jgi:hypothetical protein
MTGFANDKDALHILPLAMLPLQTRALKQARVIKNSRLEGVVELFRDRASGSGQIHPDDLHKMFPIEKGSRDIDVVRAVSQLPSFDVYSLRIELRRLGIDVDEAASLRLSEDAEEQAKPFMKAFTKPLASFLNNGNDTPGDDEPISVFRYMDRGQTRNNIIDLARRLNIMISDLPRFLEDYRDTYLSLAYFRLCVYSLNQQSAVIFRSLNSIRDVPTLMAQQNIVQALAQVERCLTVMPSDVDRVVRDFVNKTQDMWRDISAARFRAMQQEIENYQSLIGTNLCAAMAKVSAWHERYPPGVGASNSTRAAFLLTDMAPGLSSLRAFPRY